MSILRTGKERSFFELLRKQAEMAVETAREFRFLTQDYENKEKHIARIDQLEHEADHVRHELAGKVDRTFVTPLDKEDFNALSDRLDDIIDCIESATGRMGIYEINDMRDDVTRLAEILVQITEELQETVTVLEKRKSRQSARSRFVRIHELENEADEVFRKALADLFKKGEANPLYVMKWKEIYDRIERAVDKTEQAANVVESVVIKYA